MCSRHVAVQQVCACIPSYEYTVVSGKSLIEGLAFIQLSSVGEAPSWIHRCTLSHYPVLPVGESFQLADGDGLKK